MTTLGKMNAFGASRGREARDAAPDDFLIASVRRALRVNQSSLDVSDSRQFDGDSQGHLLLLAGEREESVESAPTRASSIDLAVEHLLNETSWPASSDPADWEKARLKRRVSEACRAPEENTGPATADLAVGCVLWPTLLLALRGGLHAYLMRDGRLVRLEGPPPARGRESLDVREIEVELELGDRLLVASANLQRDLGQGEIRRLLDRESGAKPACLALLDAASTRGLDEPATAIVAYFEPESRDLAAVEEPRLETGEMAATPNRKLSPLDVRPAEEKRRPRRVAS